MEPKEQKGPHRADMITQRVIVRIPKAHPFGNKVEPNRKPRVIELRVAGPNPKQHQKALLRVKGEKMASTGPPEARDNRRRGTEGLGNVNLGSKRGSGI